jgi:hypothetical protein
MDIVPATVRLLILAAVLGTAACSAPAEPSRSAATPLANTFESPEALAQAVLTKLAQRDLAGLRTLPLSESEFRDHVWPELPTSRPERNVPFDYAWGQMKQRSDGQLDTTFARYAGQSLQLVRTGATGETTTYASFAVRRDSEIIAVDEAGRQLVLRLFGSVLVKDGRFKIFSYVVDE